MTNNISRTEKLRTPVGGYGIISKWVMMDNELSLQAKGLYGLLCAYAGNSSTCFPTLSTLCRMTGVSVASISRLIAELESNDLIERVIKERKTYKVTTIKYPIYPPLHIIENPQTDAEFALSEQYAYLLDDKTRYYQCKKAVLLTGE